MIKPKLAISFSGGRTSAVMTKMLVEKNRETHDICITFANTGEEHPKTLEFVKNCDDHFGFSTVWLEAQVDMTPGKGIRHRIVDFETASRDGRPFRDCIAKYGIPNMGSPQCTTRLKENVMDSYRRSIGWSARTFDTAIGIRADEMDRMSARMHKDRFIYPLVDAGWTKDRVVAEVRTWAFDLEILEHEGNCKTCWKKSRRKLLTLAKNSPEYFEFNRRMEEEFGDFKVTPATASPCGKRLFFRGHLSTADLLAQAQRPFIEFTDKYALPFDETLDIGVGCGEPCEIGSDERYGLPPEPEEEDWI